MSDAAIIALCTGIPATIAAIGALVVALRTGSKVEEVKRDFQVVKDDVRKVEVATNSMKDALIVSTEKEALARGTKEGLAAGIAQEKDRNQ